MPANRDAALAALRSMRQDATRKRLRGDDAGGVTVRVSTGNGAGVPRDDKDPDSEVFGWATDRDKEYPGVIRDDDDDAEEE